MKLKDEQLKEIENFFKEREEFINRQSSSSLGEFCPKHEVYFKKACPLCELEKKNRISYKVEEDEETLKKREVHKLQERERLKDPTKRKRHYQNVNKYQEKERKRRIGHTIEEVSIDT